MDKFTGRALVTSGNRKVLFEDPSWDDRFDVLMELTTRTKLIYELTGTNVHEPRLKEEMNRRLAARGVTVSRPRGTIKAASSERFLETAAERYEAAYLMALHFGARGAGEHAEVETNYARAVDKRIEVYAKYRSDVAPCGGEHRITFETYCLLINGIKAGDIEVRHCGTCKTKHPVSRLHIGPAACPACVTQDLRVSEAESEIGARIAAFRASRVNMRRVG